MIKGIEMEKLICPMCNVDYTGLDYCECTCYGCNEPPQWCECKDCKCRYEWEDLIDGKA